MPSSKFNPIDLNAMDPDERAEKENIVRQLESARAEKMPLALTGIANKAPDPLRLDIHDRVIDATPYVRVDPHADIRRTLLTEKRKMDVILHAALDANKNSSTDALTGLYNKRSFIDTLPRKIHRVTESGKKLYLVMMDMDFFKSVNEKYGHPVGDLVLKELGGLLKSKCRPDEQPFRVGGEEFAVIIEADDDVVVSNFCERISRVVKDHKFVLPNGETLNKTVSMGFCNLADCKSDFGIKAKESADLFAFASPSEDPAKPRKLEDLKDWEIDAAVMFKVADNALMVMKNSGRMGVVRSGSPIYRAFFELDDELGTMQVDGTGNKPENQV